MVSKVVDRALLRVAQAVVGLLQCLASAVGFAFWVREAAMAGGQRRMDGWAGSVDVSAWAMRGLAAQLNESIRLRNGVRFERNATCCAACLEGRRGG